MFEEALRIENQILDKSQNDTSRLVVNAPRSKNMNKVSKNREKKEAIVAQLSEKAKRAKAFVFANYQGMTHRQIEDMKKGLKKVNAELVIAKNSLLRIAIGMNKESRIKNNEKTETHNSSFIIPDSILEGPTATIFAYDNVVLPIKEIAKSIKALKLPVIKFGILDGKMLAESEVIRLSTLPSRDMLLAQVVGGLKSPMYGLHRALNWNLQKFVMTLKAIETTKS